MKKLWLLSLLFVSAAQAQFTIVFDYTYDTEEFFSGDNSGRQTYLEAAGDYIANIISPTALNAITPGGSNSWEAIFTHPGTDEQVNLENPTYAANVYTIYAGGHELGGSTLGVGGTGGFSSFGVAGWSDAIRYRGNSTYSTGWGGSLSFDTATSWYFDNDINTVEPFGGMFDFFSVAVHEIVHALGFGTTTSWNSLVSNDTFVGAYATALAGENPALADGNGHWAIGTMSTIFGTATAQETAMDPDIAANQRKYITSLDVAGLQDIGYTAVPEPATMALCGGIGALVFVILRRRGFTC
jgi:hypothetical protein